jgi:hypothetical protein
MTTLAVIGATGYAGGHITDEALRRGHEVVGVSRTASREAARHGLTARAGSITDATLLDDLARQASTVVVAVRAASDGTALLPGLVPALLNASVRHGARLGFVGGAASLRVAPGGPALIDTPDFPEEYKPEARAHVSVLEILRAAEDQADWFYVSPSAMFGAEAPGERTGSFRTGDDVLLSDAQGGSTISGADYAIAFLDEIERPAHHRTRFTVGY